MKEKERERKKYVRNRDDESDDVWPEEDIGFLERSNIYYSTHENQDQIKSSWKDMSIKHMRREIIENPL